MVQVPDEMLEIIDEDRRLANDWAGLSNEEKQTMIDNWQPNQPYNANLMSSQSLGDFIGSYNRVVKPPEPEWFSEEEVTDPHLGEFGVEPGQELELPTGGLTSSNLKTFVVNYNKLDEEEKIRTLKKIDTDTIEIIQNLKSKLTEPGSWRKINSLVEDWLQVHKQAGSPLTGAFTPEEFADVEGLETLGEEFKPSSLKQVIAEWEKLLDLSSGKLDAYDEFPAIPLLIRIANELGKKIIPEKGLVDENLIFNDLENRINEEFEITQRGLTEHGRQRHTIDDYKAAYNQAEIEQLILDLAIEQDKGVIQWGVLQDLTHKKHEVFFTKKKTQLVEGETIHRWDPVVGRMTRTRIGEAQQPETTSGGRHKIPLGRLSPRQEVLEPAWMLQLKTFRGRTSSSKAYNLPLYLIIDPNIITNMFKGLSLLQLEIRVGDWFVTCSEGVIIYWSQPEKRFAILDNDNGAVLYTNALDTKQLREKYTRIQQSSRKKERWDDILEIVEKLLNITNVSGQTKISEEGTKAIELKLAETIKEYFDTRQRNRWGGRHGAVLDNIVTVGGVLFNEWMQPMYREIMNNAVFSMIPEESHIRDERRELAVDDDIWEAFIDPKKLDEFGQQLGSGVTRWPIRPKPEDYDFTTHIKISDINISSEFFKNILQKLSANFGFEQFMRSDFSHEHGASTALLGGGSTIPQLEILKPNIEWEAAKQPSEKNWVPALKNWHRGWTVNVDEISSRKPNDFLQVITNEFAEQIQVFIREQGLYEDLPEEEEGD